MARQRSMSVAGSCFDMPLVPQCPQAPPRFRSWSIHTTPSCCTNQCYGSQQTCTGMTVDIRYDRDGVDYGQGPSLTR